MTRDLEEIAAGLTKARVFWVGVAIGFWQGWTFILLCSPGKWFMTGYTFGQALFVLLHLWALWAVLCGAGAFAVRELLKGTNDDAA